MVHEMIDAIVEFEEFGAGLRRPECVLATRNGDVFVPNWSGGVTAVRADGSQQDWLARDSGIDLKPNGIAIAPDGAFLIANLGDDGGVWRLDTECRLTPFVKEISGRPLPPANFVYVDAKLRTWISVSTRHAPRQLAWRQNIADGFIVLVDRAGPRVVAEQLHYANEVKTDPTESWLYAIETFGRRLVRYPIQPDGNLGKAETVAALGPGFLPDGFSFDAEGGIWITSLVSNRVVRVDRSGQVETVISETNEAHSAAVEGAFSRGEMVASHLGPIPGTRFQHLTSIAFGGADLRTGYLGSLFGECVYRFSAPVAGARPPFWDFPIP